MRKTLKAFWFPLAALVLSVLLAVAGLWPLKEQVSKTQEMLEKLELSADAIVGCFVIAAIVFLLGVFLWCLVKTLLTRAPFAVDVRLALNRVTRQFRSHFNRTVVASRPTFFPPSNRRRWNELVAVTLEGLSDDDVMTMYCEAGRPDHPLLFCNFQSYAQVVARLLEHIKTEAERIRPPRPQVWTFFKRPVCNWYNTFPVEWIENDQMVQGQVTFDWWELYKTNVAALRGPLSKIQLHRLVADLDHKGYSRDLNLYYLYDIEPHPIATAIQKANEFGDSVTWHPSISQLLKTTDFDGKEGIKIYLIGQPTGPPTLPEEQLLLHQFQAKYHDKHKPDSDDDGGVYLGYASKESPVPQRLAVYDDVFIVKFSNQEGFGLAFVDDDIRDINGARLLPQYQLRPKEDPGRSATLYDLLVEAWNGSLEEWQPVLDVHPA